jgi:endonuclease III
MNRSDEDVARLVLARYGRTYADEAGIRLTDEPGPLFQLLVLVQLLSARIAAGIAVAAAGQLSAAGCTSLESLRDAPRNRVIAALGRAGYRRYDERTATQLRDMAALVRDRYGGDLRRLASAADEDVDRAAGLLQEINGIGPTGAAVFLREVQAVWSWVRPFLDSRAADGAARESGSRRTAASSLGSCRPERSPGSLPRSCGCRSSGSTTPLSRTAERASRGGPGIETTGRGRESRRPRARQSREPPSGPVVMS